MTEATFQTKATEQDGRLDNYETRVEAIETLGGLAPGDVSDSTVMSLVANSETGTAAQVRATVAANLPSTAAPTPSSGDDTNALNALLAANAGKTLILKAGRTYKISDALIIPDGTILDGNGATIDARNIPAATALSQKIAVKAAGTRGAPVAVSIAIAQWSKTIQGLDTTGFDSGDLILISNDERPVPGLTRTDRDKGEMATILTVDSASQVTLTAGVMFAYGTLSLTVRKIDPVTVKIRDLNVLCGGVGSGHNGVFIENATRVMIRDVQVDGAEDAGITMRTTSNSSVRASGVTGSTSSATLGNSGYGVNINDGSTHVIVTKNRFENCRHWVAGGGLWPATYVDIKGNHGNQALAAGYDCHESTFFWNFIGNTATGATGDGFLIRGQHVKIADNVVTDALGTGIKCFTWDGVSEQVGLKITGNEITKCGNGIIADGLGIGGSGDSVKRDLTISGNEVLNVGFTGILGRHFSGATILGNTVRNVAAGDGIELRGLSAAIPSTDLEVEANKVFEVRAGTSKTGVRIVDVLRPTLTGGSVTESQGEGFTLTNCFDTSVNGSRSHRATFAGLRIDGGARHTVNGGVYSEGIGANGDGIRVSNSTDVTITGTSTKNPRHGIYVTGTNHVVATGNNARENGHATKINIDAAAVNKVVANNL